MKSAVSGFKELAFVANWTTKLQSDSVWKKRGGGYIVGHVSLSYIALAHFEDINNLHVNNNFINAFYWIFIFHAVPLMAI